MAMAVTAITVVDADEAVPAAKVDLVTIAAHVARVVPKAASPPAVKASTGTADSAVVVVAVAVDVSAAMAIAARGRKASRAAVPSSAAPLLLRRRPKPGAF